MDWFEQLTGFAEENPQQVRDLLQLVDDQLTSKVNGKQWTCGRLEVASLASLRQQSKDLTLPAGILTFTEKVGNVQMFHTDVYNANALFQAASQFNLLEMIHPGVGPEQGIGGYEEDRTQGPACAIAAGAGTIYRNYLVELDGQIGQTTHHQIDCLKELGEALGNDTEQLWTMRNGYALPNQAGLEKVDQKIAQMNEVQLDALRAKLRIGLQWNTQVTLADCQHLVSQAYCSALPVAYSELRSSPLWAAFAQLVLEASYEATFHTACINMAKTGNPHVYLTLLGGGAFGNRSEWIFAAIRRSLRLFAHRPLKVIMVSYGRSNPSVRHLVETLA